MQPGDRPSGDRPRWVAGLLAAWAIALVVGGGTTTAVSVALFPAVTERSRTMPGLLGSIAIGALVGGVLGWIAPTVAGVEVSTGIAAGLGVAVGGGLGAMVWFLAVGDSGEQEGMETVAVQMESDEASPTPQPADLFAANPDPIVYFAGERPVVRTVNAAFEETFGVAAATLEDADLSEAVMAEDDADDVLEAIGPSGSYDAVRDCETVEGVRSMRLRLAVTERGGRTDGYLLYTPVGGEN